MRTRRTTAESSLVGHRGLLWVLGGLSGAAPQLAALTVVQNDSACTHSSFTVTVACCCSTADGVRMSARYQANGNQNGTG